MTSLHDIEIINSIVTAGLPPGVQGGAIEPIDSSRLLLVDASGAFYLLTLDESGGVKSFELEQLKSPMNRAPANVG